VLRDSGWAFSGAGFTVSAQVRKNEAVARRERLGDWHPELVMHGEGMEKNDGWAVSESPVHDFGVVAAKAM
jgi:hypothetical protein